jgi:predicted RNase H-like HicB family nuclease
MPKCYISSMKYTIVIHQDFNGGYWAEAPELPGCVSQGETLKELKKNMHEAIEGYLEVMLEEGRQPEASVKVDEVLV